MISVVQEVTGGEHGQGRGSKDDDMEFRQETQLQYDAFCRRRGPKRLDPVVHLQSPSWSLFTGDSSERFDESSVPAGFLPQTDTDKQEQKIAQAGGNAESNAHTCCRVADNP